MSKKEQPVRASRAGGKPARTKTKNTQAKFAEMAAEYQAAYTVSNDWNADEATAYKSFERGRDIAWMMTESDVPMYRSDEIALAKIIVQENTDNRAFADSRVEAFVMKLLNSIIASGADAST